MSNNWKSMALVGVLSAATTLGAYKFLGLDSKDVVFAESGPSVNSKFASVLPPSGVPGDFTYAAEKTVHAVVHIKSKMKAQARSSRQPDIFDFFGDDFGGFGGGRGGRGRQPQESSGSGVIISADGYIVTNNHVIEGADELEVILEDKRTYPAKLIATDPNTDIAVIQIKESNLPFISFANSDDVKVGEWVLAVGNPFNLESTVTAGIISAKGRNIGIIGDKSGDDVNSTPLESFIQTDAAVNPGNSGGALVNLRGELIGINTAIASNTGSYSGYSFAVPTSIVKKVTGDLLKFGNVQRGFLGVKIQEVNGKLAEELDLKVTQGVYVQSFNDGTSSAKAAGIKIGDVITKIDGVEIKSASKLQEMVARHRPGEAVQVTVVNKDGNARNVSVVLKNINGNMGIVKGDEVGGANFESQTLGAKFENLSSSEKSSLKIKGGAKIAELDEEGLFAEMGLEEGLIITSLNDEQVTSATDLGAKLKGKKGRIKIEATSFDDPGSRYIYQFTLR